MIGRPRIGGCLLGAMLLTSGCTTPFDSRDESAEFARSIRAAVDREIETFSREGVTLETTSEASPVAATLIERRDELEAMSPASPTNPTAFELGPDLTGNQQQVVDISLDASIASSVAHNLFVESASLQPAINREDVINAQSVFDWVVFADAELNRFDQPSTVPVINDIPLGVPYNKNNTFRFDTGVRKRFTSGGEVTVSTAFDRVNDMTRGIEFSPDPSYNAAIRLGYVQPLMRGFGTVVNTAEIRIAENLEDRAVQELTGELLDLTEATELAYWNLVLAWKDVEISQWLVNEGVDVRDVLDRRREFDTKLAQYSDAVARVEGRKADVIRARRRVRAASDQLKRLMNDPELTVGSEAVLRPVDPFLDAPVGYNLREALVTAVTNRPEIQIALLGLEDASIRQAVADNLRLPSLDLRAEVAYAGLDDSFDEAYQSAFTDSFLNYIVGLAFEYPIGNRGPEAQFRRARLERTQVLVRYRNAVQAVALDVKEALRDVIANYELIEATRSFRIAQAENLRALLVEEQTLAGLTPEFLALKFDRQETLSQARREELLALANFDQSLASLYRAMGTGLTMRGIALEVPDYEDVETHGTSY